MESGRQTLGEGEAGGDEPLFQSSRRKMRKSPGMPPKSSVWSDGNSCAKPPERSHAVKSDFSSCFARNYDVAGRSYTGLGADPDSSISDSLCEMRTAFIHPPLGVARVINASETLLKRNPPLGNIIMGHKACQDFTFGFLMLANE